MRGSVGSVAVVAAVDVDALDMGVVDDDFLDVDDVDDVEVDDVVLGNGAGAGAGAGTCTTDAEDALATGVNAFEDAFKDERDRLLLSDSVFELSRARRDSIPPNRRRPSPSVMVTLLEVYRLKNTGKDKSLHAHDAGPKDISKKW